MLLAMKLRILSIVINVADSDIKYHGFPYMSSYIYYILSGKLLVKEA